MNQVEIWLSILVRKLLKRGNFTSLEVMFAQEHFPGERGQSDFTHMEDLYQPAFRAVIFHTWHLALEAKTKLLV